MRRDCASRVGLVAVAAALLWAGPAQAQDPVLSAAGCVEDVGGPAACSQVQQGLNDASGIAISPDGQSVYVAGVADDAIVHLRRGPDGALTPAGCVGDAGTTLCGTGVGNLQEGLDSVVDVTVSPDGKQVFAVSTGDNAIVNFRRNETTGVLTPGGCFEDDADPTPECPGGSLPNLAGVSSVVAVDPLPLGNARWIYVAAAGDSALLRFPYDGANLLLPLEHCLYSQTGTDCDAVAAGLGGADDIAVSPDGAAESIYVASRVGDAIARFDHDNGTLTPQGCTADPESGTPSCGATAQGLDGVRGITISPDGDQLFAASFESRALVHFNRTDDGLVGGADGALSPIGCINDLAAPPECAASARGLGAPLDVTATADGSSVYVASFDDALTSFARRSPTGLLDPLGCIAGPGDLPGCGATTEGLGLNVGVVASPDGSSVYATSALSEAVVRFNRGVPSPPPQPPPDGAAPDNDFEIVAVKRNKAKGTAKLTVEVPGPGQLDLAGKGKLRPASAEAAAAGRSRLAVRPRGDAKRKLNEGGEAKVVAKVTYTPAGGSARTKWRKLTLIKR